MVFDRDRVPLPFNERLRQHGEKGAVLLLLFLNKGDIGVAKSNPCRAKRRQQPERQHPLAVQQRGKCNIGPGRKIFAAVYDGLNFVMLDINESFVFE